MKSAINDLKSTILVTGSTGFLGSVIVRMLAESGAIVHAFCRTLPDTNLIKHDNVRYLKGNILDKKSLNNAMNGCEQVFHLAAYADIWAKDPSVFYRINVTGTMNVMEAAKENNIRRVVYTSTGGTIGPQSGSEPLTESTPHSGYFFSEYDRTKYIAEKKVMEYANNGLNVVIVNPTRVFGPGVMNKSNVGTRVIKKYLEGNWRFIPGDGESIGNYVYVKDVANGHLLAMKKGRQGARYFLGGHNLSFNDFFFTLAKVSGKHRRLIKLPIPLMFAFGKTMDIYSTVFKKPPIITTSMINRYLYNWATNSSRAGRELGYSVTPLEPSLLETIHWLDNNK